MTLREQASDCAWHLLIMVVWCRFIFVAADWLARAANEAVQAMDAAIAKAEGRA